MKSGFGAGIIKQNAPWDGALLMRNLRWLFALRAITRSFGDGNRLINRQQGNRNRCVDDALSG